MVWVQVIRKMKPHQHKMEYEFEEGKFPQGWRGDAWCKTCDYAVYSREARRMEMFGLIRNINPPTKHEKPNDTADSAMFKINNLVVERNK